MKNLPQNLVKKNCGLKEEMQKGVKKSENFFEKFYFLQYSQIGLVLEINI